MLINGSYTFTFKTANNKTMSTADFKETGTVSFYTDGAKTSTEPLTADPSTTTYTCSGDAVTQLTATDTEKWQRR